MALTERDKSLLQVVGEAVKEQLDEMKQAHQKELASRDLRIRKLEDDVAGLISLLGEA